MNHRQHSRSFFLLLGALVSIASAAPRITADTTYFDLGPVHQGAVKSVQHVFTIKNTGDAPLQIFKVRPNCSCTEVKYDSLIPPGGVGKITEIIVLKDLPGGQNTKTVTIQSNAENRQSLTLSLNLWYVRYLDVVGDMVILEGELNDTVRTTITLISAMKDLKISKIRFIPDAPPAAGQPAPLSPLKFSVQPGSQPNAQGAWEYTISIAAQLRSSELGHYIFTTNHPRKPELRVSGVARTPE